MVLLPPYLKDRRASGQTFRRGGNTISPGSAQRFLPLQQVSGPIAGSGRLTSPGVTYRSPQVDSPNVVQLRPLGTNPQTAVGVPRSSSSPAPAVNYLESNLSAAEQDLHSAWDRPSSAGLRTPTSTASARERRRQVLLVLTGIAFLTLLPAIFLGGAWVAAHVLIDAIMLGYVILLVRHRQMMMDRLTKVEPIRPPVSEQPANVRLAPEYLLRSNTGS